MDNSISILLNANTDKFRPEERICGTVHWNLAQPLVEEINVSLLWYTIRQDSLSKLRLFDSAGSTIENSFSISMPPQLRSHEFQFDIPIGPYSYTGKLFSLVWGILVTATPGGSKSNIHITVHPNISKR